MTGHKVNLKGRLRQQVFYDAVQFVIDKIGKETVTGHFIFMYKGKEEFPMKKVRLGVNEAALLSNIKIRTIGKTKYNETE
jgi:hypothetical protein